MMCREAKEIDIVGYLANLGYHPEKIRNQNYWYRSPFREEKTASLLVSQNKNRWFDFGEGIGGNLIDFGTVYFRCSVKDFLSILSGQIAIDPIKKHEANPHKGNNRTENTLVELMSIRHPALISYLDQRSIPINLAAQHCFQIHYRNNYGNFFALGFPNQSGGYELRNRHAKSTLSPKDITVIQLGQGCQNSLLIFEGWIDFLSLLILYPDLIKLSVEVLVLNSLAFVKKCMVNVSKYSNTHLFLDNDTAGKKHTKKILTEAPGAIDHSHLYQPHKDLNDFLCFAEKLRQGHFSKLISLILEQSPSP